MPRACRRAYKPFPRCGILPAPLHGGGRALLPPQLAASRAHDVSDSPARRHRRTNWAHRQTCASSCCRTTSARRSPTRAHEHQWPFTLKVYTPGVVVSMGLTSHVGAIPYCTQCTRRRCVERKDRSGRVLMSDSVKTLSVSFPFLMGVNATVKTHALARHLSHNGKDVESLQARPLRRHRNTGQGRRTTRRHRNRHHAAALSTNRCSRTPDQPARDAGHSTVDMLQQPRRRNTECPSTSENKHAVASPTLSSSSCRHRSRRNSSSSFAASFKSANSRTWVVRRNR
jgi:hypothetical protein